MTATITINGSECRLSGITKEVDESVSDACKFEVQGGEYSKWFKKGEWDGYKRLYSRKRFAIFCLSSLE